MALYASRKLRYIQLGYYCGGEAGNWHTTQRTHHAGVEVTPLVASSPAFHVQGRQLVGV